MPIFEQKTIFVLMNSWYMELLSLIIRHYCLKGFVYCQKIFHSNNYVGCSI